MCLLQSMTCKDAINSDINSDDKKVYLLNENRRCNKDFKLNLEGTADQI
jgi:hypothetical protein